MKGKWLLLSAGLGALTMSAAGGAFAQDNATTKTPVAKRDDTVVVVTGRKRKENLQKVPAVIDVITTEKLATAGVQNVNTLQAVSPGLHVQTMAAGSFIYVRGIGASSLTGDPSVPEFIDGVYVGRGTATGGLFYDIGQVEVLKGPQGTLYGRNSTAGALVINSNRPSNTFGASASVDIGSFNRKEVEGMLNVPVTDALSFRLAGKTAKDDGYLSNGGDALNDQAGRLSVLWKPSDTFSALLVTDSYTKDGTSQSTIPIFSQAAGCSGGRFCTSNPWYTGEHPSSVRVDNRGALAQLQWKLGQVTLSVDPSYRKSDSAQLSYANNQVNGSTFDVDTSQSALEVRLESDTLGGFKWVAGTDFYHDDTRYFELVPGIFAGPGMVLSSYLDVPSYSTNSAAVFAEGTFNLTSKLRLTASVRDTSERKKQDGQGYVIFTAAPFPHGTPTNFFSLAGNYKASKPTWKLGLDYDLTSSVLLYANASTGYKAGGINRETNNNPNPNTYGAETVTAYSAGGKASFMERRLVIDGELFNWNYDGRQNDILAGLQSNPAPAQAEDIKTINLGKTELYGADLSVRYMITDADLIDVNVEYLHSQYDKNDPANNFSPTLWQGFVVEPGADLRGRQMAFSPSWSGDASYQHRFEFSGGTLTPRIDEQFQTKSYTQYRLAAQSLQPAYHKTNLSLTWTSPNERYSVMVYGRNLENAAVLRATSVAALTTSPTYFGYIEEPRNYGITLTAKY